MSTDRIGRAILELGTDPAALFKTFEQAKAGARGVDSEFEKLRKRSQGLGDELAKSVERFSGRTVIEEAARVADAIEQIGGVGKLTSAELKEVAATVQQATDKLKRLGVDAPPGLNVARLSIRQLDSELKAIGVTAPRTTGLLGQIGAVAGPLGPTLAGAFAAVQVGRAIGGVIEFSDQLVNLEAKTQINVVGLQKLKAATADAGVPLEAVAKSANTLTKRIAEGGDGTLAALRQLNIEWAEIRQQSPEDQLFRVGDAIGRIGDQGTKLRLTNDLLGKSGEEILPALNGKLKETADAYEKLGLIIDEKTVRSGAQLANQWTVLKTQGGALLANVLAPMLPAFTGITTGISKVIGSGLVQWVIQSATVMPRLKEQIDKVNEGLEDLALKRAKLPEIKGPAEDARAKAAPRERPAWELDATSQAAAIDVLNAGVERSIKLQEEQAARDERVADIRERLFGQDAIAQVAEYVDALGDVSNVAKLTAAQKDALRRVVLQALEAYKALGQQAPRELQQILDATLPLLESTRRWNLAPLRTSVADTSREIRTITNEVRGLDAEGNVLVLTTEDIAAANAEAARQTQEWVNKGGLLMPVLQDSRELISEVRDEANSLSKALRANLLKTLQDVPGTLSAALVGGGGLGNAAKAITSQLGSGLAKWGAAALGATGPWGQAIAGAVGSLLPMVSKLWGGNAEHKEVNNLRDRYTAAAGGIEVLAAKAAQAGLSMDRFFRAKTVKDYEAAIKELDAALKLVDDRAQFVKAQGGMEALQRKARAAHFDLARIFDARTVEEYEAAIRELEEAFQANVDAANDLFDAIVDAGEDGIPAFARGAIDQLIELGLLTDDQAAKLRAMGDAGAINIDKMSKALELFKGREASLGAGFQQAKLTKTATEYINALELMKAGGADMGQVLEDAKEELQELFTQAAKGKAKLPENLRPYYEELARTGRLVGENGQELRDLSGIEWGAAVETEGQKAQKTWDSILAKISELVDKITGPLEASIDDVTRDRTVDVDVNVNRREGAGEPGDGEHRGYRDGIFRGRFSAAGTLRRLHNIESVVPLRGEMGFAERVLGERGLEPALAGSGGTTNNTQVMLLPLGAGATADEIARAGARYLAETGLPLNVDRVRTGIEQVVKDWMRTYGPRRR